MTQNKRRFVTTIVRFLNACDAIEQRMYEAMDADAAFDGGEFSGPANARAARRQMDAVAMRLGFASALVAEQVADAVVFASRR